MMRVDVHFTVRWLVAGGGLELDAGGRWNMAVALRDAIAYAYDDR